jgi:DNA repair photolyase
MSGKSRMLHFITDTCNPLGGECAHGCLYCYSTGKKGLVNRYNMMKYHGSPKLQKKALDRLLTFKEGDFIFIQDMNDLF